MLLVSPERLNNPGFRDEVLPRLAATCGLLVVDEAHCISDWGHDFRPDYRRIRTLLDELPDGIPVLATTATANARVTDDVAEQLGGPRAAERRPGAARLPGPGVAAPRRRAPAHRPSSGWPGWPTTSAEQPGSGIVYCLTVAATQEVADYLRSPRARRRGLLRADRGHRAAGPRAGPRRRPGQGAGRDQRARDGLRRHASASWSTSARRPRRSPTTSRSAAPGAAGTTTRRDGRAAAGHRGPRHLGLLRLPGLPARGAGPPDARRAAEEGRAMSTAALETRVELSRTRLETMLKVLDVDGAVQRVRGGWEATGQPWTYDEERYRPRRARPASASSTPCSTTSPPTVCRMRYLRDQLDDPDAADCGRCDNCGGLDPRHRRLRRGARRGRRPPGPPRGRRRARARCGPPALAAIGVDLKGKIPRPPPRGRAVARLTDLGYGQALRDLFRARHRGRPRPGAARACRRRGARRLAPEGRRDRRRRVRAPGRAAWPTWPAGLSRYLQVPVPGVRDRRPAVEPGRGRSTPPSGSPPSAAAATSPSASPTRSRAPRCCWSTTSSAPAGR